MLDTTSQINIGNHRVYMKLNSEDLCGVLSI